MFTGSRGLGYGLSSVQDGKFKQLPYRDINSVTQAIDKLHPQPLGLFEYTFRHLQEHCGMKMELFRIYGQLGFILTYTFHIG